VGAPEEEFRTCKQAMHGSGRSPQERSIQMRQNPLQSMVWVLMVLFATASMVWAFSLSEGRSPGSSTFPSGLSASQRGPRQPRASSHGESSPSPQSPGTSTPEAHPDTQQHWETPGRTPAPQPLGSIPGPAPLGSTPSPAPLGSTPGPAPLGRTPSPAPLGSTPAPAPLGRPPSPAPLGRTPAPQPLGNMPSSSGQTR
jgi:hypothetical protein